ncbi:MAG: stage II sporulation protein R [Clostridia bacterium]|nr:stage II sporulation protein R [Clostridia bacterium]
MRKYIYSTALFALLVISVCAYAKDVCNDLKSSLIRLHVIAESDSDADQRIKLEVRDEILAAVRDIPAYNTAAFEKAAETAASEYLIKNNIPYSARVSSGIFTFPRKQYENITLPAGKYFGIRVILGSGHGRNWWCVMYPPLCVDGDTAYASLNSISELSEALRPGSREIVLGSGKRIRFKILELLEAATPKI